MLREIENLVAEAVEVNVPFMNPVTYVSFDLASGNVLMLRVPHPFLLIQPWTFLCMDTNAYLLVVTVPSHTRQAFTPRPFSTIQAPTKSLSLRISVSPVTSLLGEFRS
jgi:hypothetical protein